MRDPEKKSIQGSVYIVKPLAARVGIRVTRRLGKAVLSALAEADSLTKMEGVVTALSGFCNEMSEQDLDFVIDALSSETLVYQEGQSPESCVTLANLFDTHFAGEYIKLWEWVAFALKVNFDFLDKLRKFVVEHSATMPKAA